jgi:UPF0716 family protein affecting phage T7 exclusion
LVSSGLLIIPEFFTDMAGLAIPVLITLKAYRERNGMTGATVESPV